MNHRIASTIITFGTLLILLGCATKPTAPQGTPSPETSSIQAEAEGLAPGGDQHYKKISFGLFYGSKDALAGWSIAIVDQKGVPVKTVKGLAADAPEIYSWDGGDDSGKMAPEGLYKAVLSTDYAGKFQSSQASSKTFILDISPPEASFTPNPATFAYVPDGAPSPVSISIHGKSVLAKSLSWNLDIFDPAGKLVKTLSGALPAKDVAWDGKLDEGGYVATAQSYPAVLTVLDEFGNKASFKGAFAAADVPVAGPASITTRRGGFSPTSTSVKNTLDLLLQAGTKTSLQSWEVDVCDVEQGAPKVLKTFKGKAADLPEYVRWDGKDDSGKALAEGSYFATFSLDYGKTYKTAVAKSRPFSIVTTLPSGSITIDPPSVNLQTIGPKAPVTLTVQAKSAYAQLASWIMAVYDSKGTSIMVFNANWPNNKVSWDGKTVEGGSLVPGSTYTVVAKVQDEYGNVGDLTGEIKVEGLNSATEPSSIEANQAGFAPTGDGSASTIGFKTSVGNVESLAAWKVDIIDSRNVVERSFKGGPKQLPDSLSWDGKIDNGSYAPEGSYTAMLSLDYGVTFAPLHVESKAFLLDLTPPTGSISLSSELFAPDGSPSSPTETMTISAAKGLATIENWSLTAYDPGQLPFMSWKGDWPASPVVWNGLGQNGDLVESASEYPLVLKLRDEFGNVGTVTKNLDTDILVIKEGDGYRIRVSSIVFKAFTADYKDVPEAQAARNITTLNLLAAKLKMLPFSEYRVKLEGHAVMINWDDKAKGDAEQAAILIPLSRSRAEAIKAALIDRGIPDSRLETDGVGARNPLVPDSDYNNRWKNRRVEFFLIK